MTDKLIPKNGYNFRCETCNFSCSRKSSFDKHLLTAKHVRLTTTDIKMGEYVCVCGKKYKQRQSLHTHKKTCKGKQSQDPQEDSSISTSLASSDLVIRLLQENKEIKDAMVQQHKFIQNQSELHQQQILFKTNPNCINSRCENNNNNLFKTNPNCINSRCENNNSKCENNKNNIISKSKN